MIQGLKCAVRVRVWNEAMKNAANFQDAVNLIDLVVGKGQMFQRAVHQDFIGAAVGKRPRQNFQIVGHVFFWHRSRMVNIHITFPVITAATKI